MASGEFDRAGTFSPCEQQFAHAAKTEFGSSPYQPFPRVLWAANLLAGDGIVRTGRVLSAFAAALMAMAPLHAAAQAPQEERVGVRDRARPDYDPLGMRLGGFDLNATLDLGVTQTDNLFATETNEVDDTVFNIAPSARLDSHWSRHALGIRGGANFSNHSDFSDEDAETGYIRGDGRLDVGRFSNITAGVGFAHEVESRTDPDATIAGDPIEYDRTDYVLGASHQFSRFRLSGALGHIDYDYDAPQDFRDSDEDNVQARVDMEVTPRIGAFVQARFDDRSYDSQPALSSDGESYLAGVSLNLTELMRGDIAVGQFQRDYDSGVSVDGVAVYGNVDWFVTRLTTLRFNASRTAEDNGGVAVSPYVATEYGAAVDHELLRNVIVSAGVQAGRREYEVIDREDDFRTLSLEADYLLNRRVSVYGRAENIDVESDGANRYRTFDATQLTVGVRLHL